MLTLWVILTPLNKIVQRNKLGQFTMITFNTSHRYIACMHPKAGLIIQSSRKAGGVRMATDHPQYIGYVEAFETALDAVEADALCRALLNH